MLSTGAWAQTSLQEQINSVGDGASITLAEDITISQTILIDKNITIDASGHTITSNVTSKLATFYVNKATCNFTITNAIIDGHSVASMAVSVYHGKAKDDLTGTVSTDQHNEGNVVTLTNCTVKNFTGWPGSYVGAVYAYGYSTVELNNCTFTGNTTSKATDGASGADVWAGAAATVNISGGSYQEVFVNSDSSNEAKITIENGATVAELAVCASYMADGSTNIPTIVVDNSTVTTLCTEVGNPIPADEVTVTNGGSITNMPATEVAKILNGKSTTAFPSLSAAFAAATDGQTVTLVANTTESVINENTNAVTLNLNGYTVTAPENATSTIRNNGGTLTITGTGSVINNNNKVDKGICVWARTGSIVIERGTFTNCSNYEATVYVGTTSANLGGTQPTVTINGGTFRNTADGKYAYNADLLPLTLNIYNEIADTYQAIVVNGGTFYGNDPAFGDDSQLNNVGTNNSNFVSADYHAEKNADGVYEIESGAYVAQSDYHKYITLDAAIEAATGATTIYLLDDAETTKETLPATVTINANDKVLTMPKFSAIDGEPLAFPNITGTETYTVKEAIYVRTNIASTQWGTVCLPFTLTSGTQIQYYNAGSITESVLNITEAESVAANTPVIFNKGTTADLEIRETNATVSLANAPVANGMLIGTFTDTTVPTGNTYFVNGDQFHKVQVSLKVPAFRAYINVGGGSAKSNVLNLNVVDSGATGIEADMINGLSAINGIYDLDGRQLSAPQKGINIMKLANGKTTKMIVK